jgi:hypothetical protein
MDHDQYPAGEKFAHHLDFLARERPVPVHDGIIDGFRQGDHQLVKLDFIKAHSFPDGLEESLDFPDVLWVAGKRQPEYHLL